jgi:putative aldouronate transport system permease protein
MRDRKKSISGFNIINYTILFLAAASIVIPFIFLINQSIMTVQDVSRYGFVLLPRNITLQAYNYIIFETPVIIDGFKNSAFLVIVGTTLSLLCTFLTSYVLSKNYLPYKNVLIWIVFIPMLFSGGLIPLYLVVTWIGLMGSIWAVIFSGLINSWYVFLMRNFFSEIPDSLEESARMDGAHDMRILFQIYLPLSLPAIATIGLFYAVGLWNSWFYPGIFLRTKTQWPLQVVLRELVYTLDMASMGMKQGVGDEMLKFVPKEGMKSAAIVVSALPIIIIYPFVQKYFVKGLLIGAIKG